MDPVRPAPVPDYDLVNYQGRGDVGDLFVLRPEPGQVVALYRPDPDDLKHLNAGGLVAICIYQEPMPPIGLFAVPASAADTQPNRFRNAPELDDPARHPTDPDAPAS